jgi:hypothetical protein
MVQQKWYKTLESNKSVVENGDRGDDLGRDGTALAPG